MDLEKKDERMLPYSCTFKGRVLPYLIGVDFPVKFDLNWEDSDSGVSMRLQPHIENSNIFVNVECSAEPRNILSLLFKHALDACRLPVGMIGFQHGIGLSVVIDEVVFSCGDARSLIFEDAELTKLCTSYSKRNYSEILELIFGRIVLVQVFNDLMVSLINPHVSLVNCARVIDTLKKDFFPEAGGESAAWKRFRDALNVSEDFLKYISSSSKEARHGGGIYVPGVVCSEVVRRTWMVFDRYLNLLISNDQSLDKSQYPLLA